MVANLIENSIRHCPAGAGITVALGQEAGAPVLCVADTGPGIPDEEQQHIFDRFYRGVAARAGGVAGTGLGLAISRDIMARHGGRLTVHSVVGSGSSFALWLPLAEAPSPA